MITLLFIVTSVLKSSKKADFRFYQGSYYIIIRPDAVTNQHCSTDYLSDIFVVLFIPAIVVDSLQGISYFFSIKVSSGHNRESCVNQERARRCNRGQPLQMPLTEVGKAQQEE
jgi:hypothetical protein